jgi:hypothetical protein
MALVDVKTGVACLVPELAEIARLRAALQVVADAPPTLPDLRDVQLVARRALAEE